MSTPTTHPPILTPPIETCIVTPSLSQSISHLSSLGIGPFKRYLFTTGDPKHSKHSSGPNHPTHPRATLTNTFSHGKPSSLSIKVVFATQGHMTWEVMDPVEGPSPMADYLKGNGGREGVQHVAFDFVEGWRGLVGREEREGGTGGVEFAGTVEEREAWVEALDRMAEMEARGWECVLRGTWLGKKGTCNFLFFERKGGEGGGDGEGKGKGLCVETIVWSKDWEDPDEDDV